MATFNNNHIAGEWRAMLNLNSISQHQKAVNLPAVTLLLICAAFFGPLPGNAVANAQAAAASCEAVRVFMANDMTPYDMDTGGGGIGDNIPVFSEMPANHYADFWSFTVIDSPVSTSLVFEDVSEGMEFAIFRGMVREWDYAPITNTPFTFQNDDTYTIVVRRTDVLDDTALEYTLTVATEARGQISPPADTILRDTFTGGDLPGQLDGGQLTVNMPSATVQTHADAIQSVNTRQGTTTQVYFPNAGKSNTQTYPFHIGNWAQDLRFLGGDMALTGAERTYFLQNFGYELRLEGSTPDLLDLADVTYSDGTRIAVDWELVQGVWALDDCVGFKLVDGRTFIGELGGEARFAEFDGTVDSATVRLDSPVTVEAADSEETTRIIRHEAQFNLAEILPESEMSLFSGVFDFPLTNERRLTLKSTDVQILGTEQTDITLADLGVSVVLDWTNMAAFSVQGETLSAVFTDERRANSTFKRSAVDLQSVTALNDTIRITYTHADDSTLPGEERLLLPASYGYIELITPQGFPEFDGRAMPDENGYAPRSLNNTGAECYPTNTILPEVNCPPNGEVNPANGNLFYAVEDLTAFGGLNLSLSRSYNSRLAAIDGPFGMGWTTPYRLDYNIAFDETTASRPIMPDHSYRVGLNVNYAPRGIVTLITSSGSQHQFVSEGSTFEGGTLTAVTMPGWTLFREELLSETWTLEQVDGLTYEFDRVGRLLGYNNGTETISVDYPRDSLTGATSQTQGVRIRDNAGREIALTYDDNGHITQATLSGTDSEDELTAQYVYTDGRLTGVTYPDGTTASYIYDEAGRLIEQDDPYAPVFAHMRYEYDADGNVESVLLVDEAGEEIPHRFYSVVLDVESAQRRTTVIDEINNRREYTYRYTRGELRASAETFTLSILSNPLTEVDDFENRPTYYRYENGLMVRTDGGQTSGSEGPGAVSYEYNLFGQITCIGCISTALPSLEVDYPALPETPGVAPTPTEIRYANGTSEAFTYDENGQIATHTDTNGAVYTYTWEAGRIMSTVREQDEALTTYTYNDSGQITSVMQTQGDNTHTTIYTYDWLGRVNAIDDSVLGRYTIEYRTANGTIIVVTDPVGVRTTYQYDIRNRLVELSVEGSELLALTTYNYDIYDRLTEETAWLIDDTSGIPITTTYEHERRPTLSPLVAGESSVVINGRQITQTQPGQGMFRYTFDALDRIRRVETPFERTDYDYSISRSAGYQFGLGIQQRTFVRGRPAPSIIDYIFDSRRQLREVRTGRRRWEIQLDAVNPILPTNIRPSFEQRLSGLQSASWNSYVNGVPTSTEIRQGDLPLRSGASVLNDHIPQNILSVDYLNRPTSVTNGNGDVVHIAYCPTTDGALQEIYVRDHAATCDATDFETAMTYDASGRLIESIDEMGTRTFTYTAQPDTHTWQVDVSFIGEDGSTFTWMSVYNGRGNLIYWQDENSFEHSYTYDTLGRLTDATIADQPENSFSFRYNDANRVVEETDGLGRGFLYGYNELGQVVSRLDKSTADITSYAYTPDGQLETIITSDGSITTYRYADPLDPTRLTSIVEPTGSTHTFTWDDLTNTLVHTDPINQTTRYRYDGNGLLWRIDDPLVLPGVSNRSSELQYNRAGELTGFVLDARQGNSEVVFSFDRMVDGEIAIQEEATGWITSLAYASSGQLLGLADITFSYDPLGRITGVNTADRSWIFTREDGSPIISVVEGYTEAVELRYDSMFRLISETHGDNETTIEYAREDVTITYADGSERTYSFSPGNFDTGTPPSVTQQGDGVRIRYLYNIAGLLREIRTDECISLDDTDIDNCPSRTKSVTFSYDGEGRPLRVVDADGNFEAFIYDVAGNLVTYETKSGRRFNYTYDEIGRLSYITSPTGIQVFLEYNIVDDVVGICRAQASITDYDDCANTGGVIERYDYDETGRMTRRVFHPDTDLEQALAYTYSQDTNGGLASLRSPDIMYSATYNALGRLAMLQAEPRNYSFEYDGYGRVLQSNETEYAYDARNRLIQAGDLVYNFTESLNTLTDTLTGQSITYGINQRDAVSSINGNLLSVNYPTPDQITMRRSDGVSILQSMNLSGDALSVDYQEQLSIVHQASPTGYIQRQVITIPGQNRGYAIAIGYDNDDRPLTMRVTDIRGLRVLYTQTFTYEANGLLVRESRQYQDSTQVIIDYTYNSTYQLAQQIVRTSQTAQTNTAVMLLVGLLLIAAASAKSRSIVVTRRIFVLMAVLGGFATVPTLRAQQTSDVFTLEYVYNATGSVESIIQTLPDVAADDNPAPRIECLRFDYDGLNRLVRVRATDLAGTESQISYGYDAFNRLTSAGDFNLTYDGDRVFSIGTETTTHYFGGLAGQPPQFAVDNGGTVTWLYNDARERIVAAVPDGDDPGDIWLFDPFNRFVSLDGPEEPVDACRLSGTPDNAPGFLAVQPYGNDVVWDVRSNLYISNGRAYNPEQTRYLQRDLLAPDALGYVYSTFNERNAPPVLAYEAPYSRGLDILVNAQAATSFAEELTAESVIQRFAVTPTGDSYPLVNSLIDSRTAYEQSVHRLVNLPIWLLEEYNLPAPQRSAQHGVLRLPQNTFPAHEDTASATYFPIDTVPNWTDYQPGQALSQMPVLMQSPQPFRAYLPWTLNTAPYENLHNTPALPVNRRPDDVFDWLPQTLESPTSGAAALDFALGVSEMPHEPVYVAVDRLLDNSLPTGMQLPSETSDEWLENWFSSDTFGLNQVIPTVE